MLPSTLLMRLTYLGWLVAALLVVTPAAADDLSRKLRLFESLDDGYSSVRFEADTEDNVVGLQWTPLDPQPTVVLIPKDRGRVHPQIGKAARTALESAPKPGLFDRRIDFASGPKYQALRTSLTDLAAQVKELKPTDKEDVGLGFVPAPASQWIVYARDRATGIGRMRVSGVATTIAIRSDRFAFDQANRIETQAAQLISGGAAISEAFFGARGVAWLNSTRQTLHVRLTSGGANQALAGTVDAQSFHAFPMTALTAASQRDKEVPDTDVPQLDWEIAAAIVQAHDEPERYRRRDPITWVIGPSVKTP